MAKEKLVNGYPYVVYNRDTYDKPEMIKRTASFLKWMDKRRSTRDFSDKEVPREVIENIILTASTAPSGAHKQPWTFCAVNNPALKERIRAVIEKEEYESYHGGMPKEWVDDMMPLQGDWKKEFIEQAPWLLVVFQRVHDTALGGIKKVNYHAEESVGVASGFLLSAIHHAGLVSWTHIPGEGSTLADILGRPDNERPFLLIPVGYPAEPCYVPKIIRKGLKDVAVFYEN